MSDDFLSHVYTPRDADGVRKLYDDWSATYEREIGANGYATPRRCAEALATQTRDLSAPILDFGCGTGLGGLALKLAGFESIDGCDLSSDMLAIARDKGLYRHTRLVEADEPLRHKPGTYAAIAAIGVIGLGAAPISVFDTIMDGLAPGGLFVFSFNDHALTDPAFEGKVDNYIGSGRARLLSREHGDHLPAKNIKSTVYILEKL